ncbi:hypothetical protein [Streptomyces sp. NPDC101776]|uniref:hypothetical protein n=1 Tax=Streptomyces sp. NPDC101776 TaxID=3366146 RepID=UPI003802EDEE
MTTSMSGFQPGEILTRTEIHPVLGGSGFSGICPSREKQNVLIFSDTKIGERFGYHDGWLAEDDDLGPVFTYTGVGKRGDQVFKGGNASILEHTEKGRTLHLFIAVGKVPGTDTRTHRYIGKFKIDEWHPFEIREARDESGHARNVIVFRLRPIGPHIRLASDTLQPAPAPQSRFNRKAGRLTRRIRRQRRQKLPQTDVTRVAEARDDLADTFEESESAAGQSIGQMELSMRDSTSHLIFELFNQTNNTVYEPAGSTAGESIAQAISQLLLARHYLGQLSHAQPFHLMVLAPALPRQDLRGLLSENGIGLVYRNESGGFSEYEGGTSVFPNAPRTSRCLECPLPA